MLAQVHPSHLFAGVVLGTINAVFIVSLDLTTVAEGVENEALANAAVRLGFDYGQGFLLGRPTELEAVTA